jgi:L-galactonate dehydratase
MTFTSGSGNEVVCLAMQTLAQRIVGKSLAELTDNMALTWRTLVSGQIRWIGPEVSSTPRILRHPTFSPTQF